MLGEFFLLNAKTQIAKQQCSLSQQSTEWAWADPLWETPLSSVKHICVCRERELQHREGHHGAEVLRLRGGCPRPWTTRLVCLFWPTLKTQEVSEVRTEDSAQFTAWHSEALNEFEDSSLWIKYVSGGANWQDNCHYPVGQSIVCCRLIFQRTNVMSCYRARLEISILRNLLCFPRTWWPRIINVGCG